MTKRLTFFAVAIILAMLVHADDLEKYREFADTIRKDVYSMDLPAFRHSEVPAKYRNESAVIKAVYEEVDAKKKTGFGRKSGSLLRFSPKAQVRGGRLTRMLIHVNDKAALEKYSEFDFSTDRKKKNWDGYDKSRHVLGVRLLKPDGRTVDIDTSDFVEVEEGKKGEKKSRKLAIPGLELGDDIDVFFYTEYRLQIVHPDPIEFYLKDDAPILNYTIHCVVDDNLTTQYRTLNGAPDFNVSRDEDKNFVLDLELTDISAKEPRLWYNPNLQSPLIRMYIYNRRNSDAFTPESARKDGLQANPDPVRMLEDRWTLDDWWAESGYYGEILLKKEMRDAGKILKGIDNFLKSGKITKIQAADYIYNLLNYDYLGLRDGVNSLAFMKFYLDLLKRRKIPFALGLSSQDYFEPLDQAIEYRNNIYFAKVEDGGVTRYYFPPVDNPVQAPSDISPRVQGRKARMWCKQKERKKNPSADFFLLPVTTPDDNRNITVVNASVDGNALKINRDESYLGITKFNAPGLISWEDVDKAYVDYLNRYDLTVSVKEKKKQTADREARYDEQRKEQQADFRREAEAYHSEAPSEFISGTVTDLGIDPDNPALRYELSYTMDNLVKRAGKNLVLSIGKLLSAQTEVLPSDRNREDDVYLRTPREYVTRINIAVPDGYRVNARSLSALDKAVSNPTGSFTVKTSLASPSEVTVEVTKRYSKPWLQSSEWPDFLKIVDAASAWNGTSLLLEKK